jgi:hypothetical protein
MNLALNHTRTITILLLSLILLVGCASLPVASDIKSEARSGYGLLVYAPRVSRASDALHVVGSVARGAYYSGFSRIHLDVEVVSPEGRRLALAPTRFSTKPLSYNRRMNGYGNYVTIMPGNFPPGCRVQVTVHAESLRKCEKAASILL